jgi:hypothetical protein
VDPSSGKCIPFQENKGLRHAKLRNPEGSKKNLEISMSLIK